MIRDLLQSDIEKLREIHERFYKDEFEFPDFLHNFICSHIITENDQIVCVGGIRLIAESVIITNKELSPRIRKDALLRILARQLNTLDRINYSEGLHAFVQDERWISQLIRYGFRRTKGQSLIIG